MSEKDVSLQQLLRNMLLPGVHNLGLRRRGADLGEVMGFSRIAEDDSLAPKSRHGSYDNAARHALLDEPRRGLREPWTSKDVCFIFVSNIERLG